MKHPTPSDRGRSTSLRIGAVALAVAITLPPATVPAAMVRLSDNGSLSYHDSLSGAYGAISGDTATFMLAQAGTFRESLDLTGDCPLTLSGGYDNAYGRVVGSTLISGTLTVSSGSLEASNLILTAPADTPVRIIYLHHSTGANIWNGGVPDRIADYNTANGTDYRITERPYPDSPYPWNNYPYDYWKLWVDTTGPTGFDGQDTLDTLTDDYDLVVFKHCFPVSDIEADTGSADAGSDWKSLENYRRQYDALKARMHQFPAKKFIVWTGAALTQQSTSPESAERARQFFTWVRNSWDETGDNIFVWDFWSLETGGGLYLKAAYAADPYDSHPNATFSASVAPYVARRIIDVIEGSGDRTSITGTP